MYGVVDGVYYNHLDRTEELSKRMYNRNIPSSALQPNFSIRPVATKYDIMPVFDRRQQPTVAIKQQPTYNVQNIFNPGTAQAPWSGYSTNVNDESTLRNQFFALQKSAQSVYIPPSTSDMYVDKVFSGSTILNQPFPDLFIKPDLETFNPNSYGIAGNTFSNHTRQQIKMV
jgi:hypothetical protein